MDPDCDAWVHLQLSIRVKQNAFDDGSKGTVLFFRFRSKLSIPKRCVVGKAGLQPNNQKRGLSLYMDDFGICEPHCKNHIPRLWGLNTLR